MQPRTGMSTFSASDDEGHPEQGAPVNAGANIDRAAAQMMQAVTLNGATQPLVYNPPSEESQLLQRLLCQVGDLTEVVRDLKSKDSNLHSTTVTATATPTHTTTNTLATREPRTADRYAPNLGPYPGKTGGGPQKLTGRVLKTVNDSATATTLRRFLARILTHVRATDGERYPNAVLDYVEVEDTGVGDWMYQRFIDEKWAALFQAVS